MSRSTNSNITDDTNSNNTTTLIEKGYKICKTNVKGRIVCGKKLPESNFKLGRLSCKECSNKHAQQIYTNGKEIFTSSVEKSIKSGKNLDFTDNNSKNDNISEITPTTGINTDVLISKIECLYDIINELKDQKNILMSTIINNTNDTKELKSQFGILLSILQNQLPQNTSNNLNIFNTSNILPKNNSDQLLKTNNLPLNTSNQLLESNNLPQNTFNNLSQSNDLSESSSQKKSSFFSQRASNYANEQNTSLKDSVNNYSNKNKLSTNRFNKTKNYSSQKGNLKNDNDDSSKISNRNRFAGRKLKNIPENNELTTGKIPSDNKKNIQNEELLDKSFEEDKLEDIISDEESEDESDNYEITNKSDPNYISPNLRKMIRERERKIKDPKGLLEDLSMNYDIYEGLPFEELPFSEQLTYIFFKEYEEKRTGKIYETFRDREEDRTEEILKFIEKRGLY